MGLSLRLGAPFSGVSRLSFWAVPSRLPLAVMRRRLSANLRASAILCMRETAHFLIWKKPSRRVMPFLSYKICHGLSFEVFDEEEVGVFPGVARGESEPSSFAGEQVGVRGVGDLRS